MVKLNDLKKLRIKVLEEQRKILQESLIKSQGLLLHLKRKGENKLTKKDLEKLTNITNENRINIRIHARCNL